MRYFCTDAEFFPRSIGKQQVILGNILEDARDLVINMREVLAAALAEEEREGTDVG